MFLFRMAWCYFFLFSGLTLLGFPAGCPSLFFWLILLLFSEEVISFTVFGVLEETRFLGRQYGVPRFSPFLRPQGFPVRTSVQSSLTHRRRSAPFLVFLGFGMAVSPVSGPYFSALCNRPTGVSWWEDFVAGFDLVITSVFFGRFIFWSHYRPTFFIAALWAAVNVFPPRIIFLISAMCLAVWWTLWRLRVCFCLSVNCFRLVFEAIITT